MLYLDANVFIYAAVAKEGKGKPAIRVLRSMGSGTETAVTASLTMDEVAWSLQRLAGRDVAIEQVARLLEFPNLRILAVGKEELTLALELMSRHRKLAPRDAIHAAVAMNAGVYTILSDDPDFDAIPELTRRPLG